MSASLDGVDVNFMNSGAALGESDKGSEDRMDDNLGRKNLIENSVDIRNSSDGVRVLDEAKVLTGEINKIESINSGLKREEFGNMNDKNDGSKRRVVEMMSRDDGWRMMNMVGRLLDGKLGIDKEVEDGNTSENSPGINLVVDLKPWRETVVDPTSKIGILINGNAINDHMDMVNLGYPSELVPDGKTETKEVNNAETDVLMTEGYGKQDSITNELAPGGKSEIEEADNARADVLMTEVYELQDSITNELAPGSKSEIEEVGNVRADMLMMEGHGEMFFSEKYAEKDEEYYASDLVWGKVRSHPWWPGQIFAPSAASDKAVKYCKNDSYLIAYFGDRTFSWNEVSKIKPFLMNFSEMKRQSNKEGFVHAVSCALDDVSRRVEVGLLCPCLPEEVRNKIETQVVVNAGIREESCKLVGGDRFFTAEETFLPEELVDFVELMAKNPSFNMDRLQVSIMKAQFRSFNRWRGRYHPPSFEEFGELLEDVGQFDAKGERRDYEVVNVVRSKKRKSVAQNVYSKKCNNPLSDENLPDTKKKHISSLQSSGAGKSEKGKIISTNSLTSDVGNKGKKSSNMETTDKFVFEGMEDSYWTDRVIQSSPPPKSRRKSKRNKKFHT